MAGEVVGDASRDTGGAVVRVRGLVKRFGAFRALDGLDLEVRPGEVHGFLGPNGSGKSTTIRALLGLVRTDGGTAQVLGLDPWRDTVALHRRLAHVPGDVALWPQLTGGETVDLLLRLRGVDPARSRRDEMLERFGLDPRTRARAYSKGNRQKVALVAALSADCELLVLDEPTTGLDPLVEEEFALCVAERRAAGATVLLSSHVLAEVERLADRVTIIREGRTVESGSLEDLRHLRRSRVVAEVDDPTTLGRTHGAGGSAALPGVHDLEVAGHRVTCTVDPAGWPGLLERLTAAGVRSLTSSPPTLEELFLDAYRTSRPGRQSEAGA